MKNPDSDVAKALRRLEFEVDRDDNSDSGMLGLVILAGIELTPEDRMYLAGPFMFVDWGGRPEWLRDLAELERFEIVVEKQPGIVGPAEFVMTLWEADRDEWPAELVELYRWAYVKTLARHLGRDLWKPLGMKPIADTKMLKSEVYELLAVTIRRKVVGVVQRAAAEAERQEAYRREWEKKKPATPVQRQPAQPKMF